MINIIGLVLTFIGTILTLLNIIMSKPDKKGTTWGTLEKISPEQHKAKKLSILGLSLMSIGFLLQLIVAIQTL